MNTLSCIYYRPTESNAKKYACSVYEIDHLIKNYPTALPENFELYTREAHHVGMEFLGLYAS